MSGKEPDIHLVQGLLPGDHHQRTHRDPGVFVEICQMFFHKGVGEYINLVHGDHTKGPYPGDL